jgi:predicted nucleotidyltransferase
MTDEEIIKKAGSHWQRTRGTMDSYLKMIIKIAREDEREACALVCADRAADDCAVLIRLRGEPKTNHKLEEAWEQAIK